jgi:hypothetical protein
LIVTLAGFVYLALLLVTALLIGPHLFTAGVIFVDFLLIFGAAIGAISRKTAVLEGWPHTKVLSHCRDAECDQSESDSEFHFHWLLLDAKYILLTYVVTGTR